MKLQNKNIIVTGGGNGVGRELVLQLLEKGATVFAADINMERLQETARIAGNSNQLFLNTVDISNQEQVNEFAQKVIMEHQSVDAIINNAGIIQPFITVQELGMDQIERVMNVNFYGTLYMVRAFLSHLTTRPEAHIVNVSSMGGFLPVPGQSIYGASKAAVRILTEGLSSELEDTNVHVSCVIPGGIATDIKKNSNILDGASKENTNTKLILTPKKAAELTIHAMEKERLRTFIGKDCKTMNFLYKVMPNVAMKLINKALRAFEN